MYKSTHKADSSVPNGAITIVMPAKMLHMLWGCVNSAITIDTREHLDETYMRFGWFKCFFVVTCR